MGLLLSNEERIKRLEVACERMGGKAALGRALGYKDGAFVGQMLRGDRPITEKTMAVISGIQKLSDLFTFSAHAGGFVLAANNEGLSPHSNVAPADLRARVPIINWVQAGAWSDIEPHFDLSEYENWHEIYKGRPGRHAFALVVEGDSMMSPYPGERSFPPGTVIVVDPDRGASAGDYVVAKDVSTQKATFKRLAHDAGRWYLRPLNPSYPTLEIDDPAIRVIGRVIEFSICGVL